VPEQFAYDVFVSHSSKDKPVVRAVAERLRADGLRVWFDAWELRPGDSIPAKIEEGLEHSRVLVLCMSANAFGSEWTQLEYGTFRFRDPLNKERRFIPLRLDDAPIKGSLAQFLYVNWHAAERDEEYPKLLGACRPPAAEPILVQPAAPGRLQERILSLGHAGAIYCVTFSPDGKSALSGSADKTVRLWDVETGGCLRVLEGHSDSVLGVAWGPDGHRAVSASADKTVRIWDLETGSGTRVLEGHSANVLCVAWSPDGRHALSGARDRTVRLWDVETGDCVRVLEGHSARVLSVAWSPDSRRAVTGSGDGTVRLWDVESGACSRVLEGHSDRVESVAWSPDGRCVLSGADDHTLRLWDVKTGGCLRVLEGHSDSVRSVAWSPDGRHAVSGADDDSLRLWYLETGTWFRVLAGHSDSVLSVAWNRDGNRALSGAKDNTLRLWDLSRGNCLRVFEGHSASVLCVAWNPDGRRAVSGARDNVVQLWDVETGSCLQVLEGHTAGILSVVWSPDGRRVVSGAEDFTVRVWDVETGRCLRVLAGHSERVWSVAFSPDGRRAVSGAGDRTVRVWDVETGRCLRILEGHFDRVWCVAWSPDGRCVVSGSQDHTARVWEVETGRCVTILEGQEASVLSVAFSPDNRHAVSGAGDRTLRVWDVETGRCLSVFEGHSASVWSVAWSPDGDRVLSGAEDHTVRLWDVSNNRCLSVRKGHSASIFSVAWTPDGRGAVSAAGNGVMRVWDLTDAETTGEEAQVQYTNAKVLLVGESGAGKTGLSMRLALNEWKASDSTVGAWATHWKLPVSSSSGVEREIWLWDFGGQADQRLIHQLYMEDTALAVLVFDGQKEDLFEALGQWDRDLTRASRRTFAKLLAAGRVDAGGLRVSRKEVEKFAKERGFRDRLFETSAKAGTQCEELKQAILAGIDWENIPWRSSPLLFKRLKEEIVRLKDEDRVLMRFNELRDALRLRLAGEDAPFKDEELKTVVALLTGPGVVWELKFGNWVLLQPERINAYAQSVIQTLRADEFERGCLPEERVLNGGLTYHSSMQRLDPEEERFVLLAMHQTLVERGLCLREQTDKGPMLIFPSFYRRERPELTGHPAVLVSYRFAGFLDDIYATLVVRLHHTRAFQQDQLWRYAADFKTATRKQLGVKLTRRAEGAGELEVYFDPGIAVEEKIIFIRYVHEHLLQKGQDVLRLRHYVCPHCGTPVGNREVAMGRLDTWLEGKKAGSCGTKSPTILCVQCEGRVPLWDDLEECFASDETRRRVHELQAQCDLVLANESRERTLVGEVISTVALAGQICRELNVSDRGIDVEVEFKDDSGEATGRKLYLVLKSVDSIEDERLVRYWMEQAFPVLLVIRTPDGEVRWMEVRDSLKQIDSNGERFDVMSVRRWRDRVLGL
jgi:small GTP-binding protein